MNSSSSSSSSSSSNWFYDVFLSFRGTDTRRNFVSFLHKELDRKNIETFKDDEKLERGEYISSGLLQAIENSRFAIVVVSEKYASSKWCLKELAKIMERHEESKLIAIPIFYKVEPRQVKCPAGKFHDDLKQHEQRGDPEEVKGWKDALTQLAKISGYSSTNCKDDSELVQDIVEDISNRLIKTIPSNISGLFGMDVHMKEMYKLLDLESRDEVRVVGIWGMGGIGKTTLAKYVYEKIRHHFQFHRFLEKVKERRASMLQEELLSENYGALEKGRFFAVPNVIETRLGRRKVLLVVDDVDNMEQLHAVVGDTRWFGPGSRVIITTRDWRLLEGHGVEHVYKVPCLEHDDAFRLFCRFGFPQKRLLTNFTWLSKCAVRLAGGLPLALETFGSYLRNRPEADWETALDILKRSPDKEVKEILKISYDGLSEQEKALVLLFSCVADYRDRLDKVKTYAGIQHFNWGVKQLVQKSFMHIFLYSIFMHDLVLQMGREVGRQQYLTEQDEIRDVLANSQGTATIEGIRLYGSHAKEGDEIMIDKNAFEKIPNLKYFIIDDFYGRMKVSVPRGVNFIAPKLQYLCWYNYPHKTLQFTANNLAYLDLRWSELENLWDHRHPPCLPNLRKVEISFSKHLKEFPNLSKALNVEEIRAVCCESLTEIPLSISCLNKLILLDLTDCEQLKRLPSNMDMESLECVDLDGCTSLEVFPRFSRGITMIHLSGGRRKTLSKSIGYLSRLEILHLGDFKWLKSLPDAIGELISLQELRICGCPRLRRIPKTIQKLKSLKRFWVSDCQSIAECPHLPENVEQVGVIGTGIKEFSPWIGDLRYLEDLCVEPNKSSGKGLPAIIYNLKSLRRLFLEGSFNLDLLAQILAQIPHFAKLEVPNISLPKKLNEVSFRCPPLSSFPFLEVLKLVNLNMEEIPDDLGELTHLKQLDLTGNDFEEIPVGIKQLIELDSLILKNCKKLRSLPELPSYSIGVCAHGCTALETSLLLEEHWQCREHCKDEMDMEEHEYRDSKSTYGLITPSKRSSGVPGIHERLKSKALLCLLLCFGIGLAFVALRLLFPSPRAITSPSPPPLPPPPPDASSTVAPRCRRFSLSAF